MKKAAARAGLAFGMAAAAVSGGALVKRLWVDKYLKQKAELDFVNKQRDQLLVWLQLRQAGVKLDSFFHEKGWKTVAVLGMNPEGRLLLDELDKGEGIVPVFAVEAECFGAVHPHLAVYRLGEDPLPSADCLVVCGQKKEDSILPVAQEEFNGLVVTLDSLLKELAENNGVGVCEKG